MGGLERGEDVSVSISCNVLCDKVKTSLNNQKHLMRYNHIYICKKRGGGVEGVGLGVEGQGLGCSQ